MKGSHMCNPMNTEHIKTLSNKNIQLRNELLKRVTPNHTTNLPLIF